jgi:hypothetical protein
MIFQELNLVLIRTLHFEHASIIAAVICSLIVAGLLKGTIGVGMPVVALPLLSLFIDIKSAAMLLSMPLIFRTVPHAIDAGVSWDDSRPFSWRSSPVSARCERCKDYRRPGAYGWYPSVKGRLV